MLGKINKVTLVLDRNFGARLELIASASHVWVIDTPTNRIFAEDYWRQGVDDERSGNITTFKVSDGTPDILDIFDLLDTIDLHHGLLSSTPPYAVLEVIGLPLSAIIRSRIRKLGFTRFEPTGDGFCAKRISTSDN